MDSRHLMADKKICFVGAGSMAEAIIRGLIDTKLMSPEQISAVNRGNQERLKQLSDLYGLRIPRSDADKETMIREAHIVMLAMKPKDAANAIRKLAPLCYEGQLIVSVIAGLSMQAIEGWLGKPLPIVRTMPNTSSTIGLSATGLSFSSHVSDEQRQLARAIFESVGIVKVVDESLLDAVTGVSGSGPAYIYYVMEAIIQGGIACGLTRQEATELTVQTVVGAAEMVRTTGEEPAELRRKVTSPGGTTEAALKVMADYKLQEAVTKAVTRAAERAAELGAQMNQADS